jgi:hypothetical protein
MSSLSMRTANAAASIAYALQALALWGILVVTGAQSPLPVVAGFRAADLSDAVTISTVDLGWALVTVLLGGAVTHAVVAARSAGRLARDPDAGHPLTLVAGWSQGSAIVVFLVAQLNGIVELTSLVPLYAITATAVVLVGIDRGGQATWRRPGAWAAAVGIVPWGVIAFAQIGATLTLGGPSLGVRVVTLIALATATAGWVIGWRRHPAPRVADLVAMTVAVALTVWSIVVLVVLGA